MEKWPDFFRDFRGDTIAPGVSGRSMYDEICFLELKVKFKMSGRARMPSKARFIYVIRLIRCMGESPKFNAKLRDLAEAANDVGFSKAERREFAKGPEAQEGALLHTVAYRQTIEDFLGMLAGKKSDTRNLVHLGSTLREFGSRGEGNFTLREQEKKIVSMGVKYFEKWMYEGGMVRDIHMLEHEQLALATPAFLVNQIAKIKEKEGRTGKGHDATKIAPFDKERLSEFIAGVETAAEEIFSDKELKTIDERLARKRQEIEAVKENFKAAQQHASPIFAEIRKVENGLVQEVQRVVLLLKSSISTVEPPKARVLERVSVFIENVLDDHQNKEELIRYALAHGTPLFESILKTAEEAERRKSEIYPYRPSAALLSVRKDFETLQKAFPVQEDKPVTVQPLKLSGFAALAAVSKDLKEQLGSHNLNKAITELASKKYVKEIKVRNELLRKLRETGYYELQNLSQGSSWDREYMSLIDFKRARERAMKEFAASLEAVKRSLREPAGDMYLLKSCLIAAQEARVLNRRLTDAQHIPNIQRPDTAFGESGGRPVYNFGDSDMSRYDKVHMEPSHFLFCQIAVEYLWRKGRESKNS